MGKANEVVRRRAIEDGLRQELEQGFPEQVSRSMVLASFFVEELPGALRLGGSTLTGVVLFDAPAEARGDASVEHSVNL